ncbi:hypothetical protein [Ferrimonas senticii]|uniref:hypothetical protein n=1 Tax=Ferrimonas senticii TaxID=394566 RepID=UPI0012EC6069|nr:hypothetical protein [Ferrimonas senticii]
MALYARPQIPFETKPFEFIKTVTVDIRLSALQSGGDIRLPDSACGIVEPTSVSNKLHLNAVVYGQYPKPFG